MSDIINLNQQRKAKLRNNKTATAEQNRVKFGRTKAQKQLEKTQSAQAAKKLSGHQRKKPSTTKGETPAD